MAVAEPSLSRVLAVTQGAVYLGTGVWALVHRDSFERVTGPKTDFWLVRTVGALIGIVGGTLLWAGVRRRVSPELKGLAMGSAAVLGSVDVVYTAKGRIPPVYLLDAVAEAALTGGWLMSRLSPPAGPLRRGL